VKNQRVGQSPCPFYFNVMSGDRRVLKGRLELFKVVMTCGVR